MTPQLVKHIKLAFFAITLSLSQPLLAAQVSLATAPLVNSSTAQVLPNIMYILDNSGSMGWDFMPDYVDDDDKCKDSAGVFNVRCEVGDPPRMSAQFNSIYYNPKIRYSPPIQDSNGLEMEQKNAANTAGWTNVRTDPFNRQNSDQLNNNVNSISLLTGYPDRVFCNIGGQLSNAQLTDPAICQRNNGDYQYPDVVYSSGGYDTGGRRSQFITHRVFANPYYYNITAGEYCTDKQLTNCKVSPIPTGTFTFPASIRWCQPGNLADCQARYIDSQGYTVAKYGLVKGTRATATLQIKPDPSNPGRAAPNNFTVSSIIVNGTLYDDYNQQIGTVSGVDILGATVSGKNTDATSRSNLASAIANQINAFVPTAPTPDFIASVSGDTITVSPVMTGKLTGSVTPNISASQTVAEIPAVPAVGTITVNQAGKVSGSRNNTTTCTTNSTTCPVTVTIPAIQYTSSLASAGTTTLSTSFNHTTAGVNSAQTQRDLATAIKNNINGTTTTTKVDYTATCGANTSGTQACTTNVITVTAVIRSNVANATGNGLSGNVNTITYTTLPTNIAFGTTKPSGGVDSIPGYSLSLPIDVTAFTGGQLTVRSFDRVDIVPSRGNYPFSSGRTDCLSLTNACSYAEEMTNFANWYSYYRTRMQMMKTSTTRAFKNIDTRYRVGFITIADQANNNYLPINRFDAAQKNAWYSQLTNTPLFGGTPLRSALSTVGKIYAGKKPVGTADPMQYSCQQNFSILTTDGYWNGGVGTDLDNASVGDRDGAGTARPLFQGSTQTADSLADVAMYYYDTDLRDTSLGNCTGGPRADGSTGNVCANNVFTSSTDNNIQQHMTTFTLGLGVDGELVYDPDYQTATSGDFYNIKNNTLNWPVPAENTQRAVDDLWHAAVNGRGTYFSAKDPNQLSTSLNNALQSIGAKVGAAAAAATSSLNPVAGDNFAYVGSYTNQKWTGNLESRVIDVDSGAVSKSATWCVEDVLDTSNTCESPSVIRPDTSNGAAVYNCVTPNSDAASCVGAGVLEGTDCKVPVATACTGTFRNKVATQADTRNILMNVNGALGQFTAANLVTAGKNANFLGTFLANNLTQWNSLTSDQKAAYSPDKLVNYLRGQSGYELRSNNLITTPTGPIDLRYFRLREATMGDPLESTPIFVGVPKASYSDPNYGPDTLTGSFKSDQKTRAGTVFVGANDGMLHAFNAATGEERWAFVPSVAIPNLWKLANSDYASNHVNYVNGETEVYDFCASACSTGSAVWKTILIGALNGGGKGYYALDITSPNSPSLLWEFNTDSDLGYSFGKPIVTKKQDGTWVAILTSGYNNSTGSNPGKGVMYVLNANSGTLIDKYITSAGDATTPSGLAKVSYFVENINKNNTAGFVYGGDLLGNLWRFDINTAPASNVNPYKVATLKDPSGNPQPITTEPELKNIGNQRVIYVGTGKYLEINDLSDTQVQTMYAITDKNSFTTLANARDSMTSQTFVTNTTAGTRAGATTSNAVDLIANRGWYIDFPAGERVNVAARLESGTLIFPTIVPSSTECSPGGTGWLNFVDYKTGAPQVAGALVSVKTNTPIVGVNIYFIKGKPVVAIVTANDPTPTIRDEVPFGGSSGGDFSNHGVIWRELIEE